ncbi:zinc finger MYM-type protein 1-like [Hyperolius riggenbachi]|uniref:zinc finger MYM-type protein 1-like n=1 Tax=Hyperolius riggenbachi TaxID=752182 RepID=UPI0035A3AFF4
MKKYLERSKPAPDPTSGPSEEGSSGVTVTCETASCSRPETQEATHCTAETSAEKRSEVQVVAEVHLAQPSTARIPASLQAADTISTEHTSHELLVEFQKATEAHEFSLIKAGFQDWKNCAEQLKNHENSADHHKYMTMWKELEIRLQKGKTIDKVQMELYDAEKKRWRAVLTRLVAIIQSLAERNIALRGKTSILFQPNNGNFLKEVELLAKFDPVLKQHLSEVQRGASHTTYLGPNIQNELIDCIGSKITDAIVKEVKDSKYYAIILDCTPDVSHKEQMSVIIRIVALESLQIKEHFMGFLEAEETTGEGLASLILKRLGDLNISFEDCRGQSYDNGANMRGKRKGVQARLLEINPRAFFVPCGAHTLNLVVADAAKNSPEANAYFGYLQNLFKLFSASTQRWTILKSKVTITLKSWSETRWESRVESVEAVRYQASNIREALLQVRETSSDPGVQAEAQSLAEEVGSFRFLICTVVWYDILQKIQIVSKLMQSESMQLDVAVDLLKKTEASLLDYRGTGFVSAQISAKDICEEMNVEPVLKQKRLRKTKLHFSYEAPDEPIQDALKQLEVSFFNMVVDTSIASLQERFLTVGEIEKKFGVLTNFPNLSTEEKIEKCTKLSDSLTYNGHCDLDGKGLAQELQVFPDLPKSSMTALELLAFLQEKRLMEIYPNMWLALRIAVTTPITVASAERSFSKLKLIKNYLRSTMSQERLNGLAMMSINRDVSGNISFDDVINDFAARKSRRVKF